MAGPHDGTTRGGRRTSRPTIVDVARRAGVSKSLVSLVLRDTGHVSEERREAVLAAVRELGYRPNAAARSLVRRQSHIVGVLLAELHNPYFADCVEAIDRQIGGLDYRTILTTGHLRTSGEVEALQTLLEMQVDGLLLISPTMRMSLIREAVREVPVVMVARGTADAKIDSVVNDDRRGARLAVDHLVQLGHRRIAHVDGGRGAGASQRRSGFERALRRHGIDPDGWVAAGAFTEEGGAKGMRALLDDDMVPTAVFAANDLAATGVLAVLEEIGSRVPDDVSVVGYDNTQVAGMHRYDLTSVDQPRREMGRTAVDLLLERIDGDRDRAARHLVLPPSLVVRGSTAPPPDSDQPAGAG